MVRVSRYSPALRDSHVLELLQIPTCPCLDSAQGYAETRANLGLVQPVIIRQFRELALVLREPCRGRHAPGPLLGPPPGSMLRVERLRDPRTV